MFLLEAKNLYTEGIFLRELDSFMIRQYSPPMHINLFMRKLLKVSLLACSTITEAFMTSLTHILHMYKKLPKVGCPCFGQASQI